jgi:hypothetical protein
MDATAKQPSSSLAPLAHAWLALIGLTLVSLALGERFHGMAWLQLLVAAIVWMKGILVARRFIEVGLAHPFIRRVVFAFIAFTPLALVAVTYFGAQVARWASL